MLAIDERLQCVSSEVCRAVKHPQRKFKFLRCDAKEQHHPAFITLTTQLTLSISPDDISYIPKKTWFHVRYGDEWWWEEKPEAHLTSFLLLFSWKNSGFRMKLTWFFGSSYLLMITNCMCRWCRNSVYMEIFSCAIDDTRAFLATCNTFLLHSERVFGKVRCWWADF